MPSVDAESIKCKAVRIQGLVSQNVENKEDLLKISHALQKPILSQKGEVPLTVVLDGMIAYVYYG
jgi:hypothetical protein